MSRLSLLIFCIILLSCLPASLLRAQSPVDYTAYVNPFIGTAGFGHTFPGPARPFSLVQLSPDTDTTGWDYCAGYRHEDGEIIGFSHTHLSGTGCADLGDILIMPVTGRLQLEPGEKGKPETGYRSAFSHSRERASVGYYSVFLEDPAVQAELTSSPHAGLHRYTFSRTDSAWFVIDLRHRIDKGNNFDKVLDAGLNFENDSTLSGYVLAGGWAPIQHTYFVMRFSKPFTSFGYELYGRLWQDIRSITARSLVGYVGYNPSAGEHLTVSVGISTTSIEGARKNLEAEIPHHDFEKIAAESKASWNDILSRLRIQADEEDLQTFYTAMYHACIAPSNIADVDGRYRGVDYAVHQSETGMYYSTFSLWDTYRAAHPLYTLLVPEKVPGMINSMLDHYDRQGFLPIWTLWGTENYCMIGNHAIPVIVDAYLKGIGGFDAGRAWKAVYGTSTRIHKKSSWDLIDRYGYLPADREMESASRTVEIAYNDWCVARMAQALGKEKERDYFLRRSESYRNLFDASKGFFRGKNSDGSWLEPFNPLEASYYNSPYTEGNAWQYSWYVPQDVRGMIELYGGNTRFVRKLDSLFGLQVDYHGSVEDMSGFIGQYAHGNEPSHHIAYLYDYAGMPWKTQERVKQVLDTMYSARPDGLCGNEDCGQMSSWYIFSTLGFYPVNPADGTYLIGAPRFPVATLSLAGGKTFTVRAEDVSDENIYIQSARLNGKKFERLYLLHKEILEGGELKLVMGPRPNKQWAAKPDALPPIP